MAQDGISSDIKPDDHRSTFKILGSDDSMQPISAYYPFLRVHSVRS
jgi:hypothetical protein